MGFPATPDFLVNPTRFRPRLAQSVNARLILASLSGPASPIEREGAEHRRKAGRLPDFLETGRSKELRKQPRDVIPRSLKAVEKLDQQEGDAHQGIRWLSPVRDVKLSARPQHSEYLFQCPILLFPRQMVKEQARKDAVEGAVGVRKFIGHCSIQGDIQPGPGNFPPRDFENPGIGIQPDDPGLEVSLLNQDREGCRAAAKVEDAVAWLDAGLLDEAALEGGLADAPPDQKIVQRCQTLVPQGSEIFRVGVGLSLLFPIVSAWLFDRHADRYHPRNIPSDRHRGQAG